MLAWLGDWAHGLWYWVAIVTFLGLACWETFRPARKPLGTIALRWLTHGGLYAADTFLLAIFVPAAIASWLAGRIGLTLGLFNHLGQWAGDWSVLIAGVLLLDLSGYVFHRIEHRVFVLWCVHAVHHSDIDMDASTTFRHHPIEGLISTAITGVVFAVLGVPEWIFPVYALVGVVFSLSQHVNAGVAGRLDHALQWVFVTPGMHQIHHSTAAEDYEANFGTVLSIWDRIFGTYRQEPAAGRDALTFGVRPFTTLEYARPSWTWMLPFAMRRPTEDALAGSQAD